MSGQELQPFFQEDLVWKLWSGVVVAMDNLPARKILEVTKLVKDAGARIVYLSAYFPEFNPIEHLWLQLKNFLRKFSLRT